MLEKNYTPKAIEDKLYQRWEASGAFAPQTVGSQGVFTIMMPPPNVTGSLHMGHALNYTLQDILVRYHRMRGVETHWQPGTDHAGIATQMMVEKQLAEEGLNRRDMGRAEFLKRVWQWKEKYGDRIVHQQRRMGLTPDWSRHRFTLDEGLNRAVRKVFVMLHRDGLIYRDKRLVNWDPQLLTAVSDLEVDAIEVNGNLWHLKYKIEGEEGRFITVATTRPETLFGDTGIAVHPEDERYKDLLGKKAIVPFVNRAIPIIADEHCDPEKGSGAVKITPAHDFNDFEVGMRHGLERLIILDEHGHLSKDLPAPFAGLERFEARKRVVQELEALGQLEKIEPTLHSIPHGERSGAILEPRLTDQWFVNAKPLADEALKAVQEGRTQILPESGRHVYDHWMTTIQPWCISRQLWWGHQIPAWTGPDGHIFVAESTPEAEAQAQEYYGKKVDLVQDPDVLDTWFSAALWPFSTLGWPEKTPELERYYPTSCLITGTDIIFFWVARMMMMGLYVMKDVPFRDIYLHALVRDEFGQKMSKTIGNVIDPLEVMEQYGADALRFTVTAFAAPGRDMRYANKLVEGYRNFATKLWNAARYLENNEVSYTPTFKPQKVDLDLNKWVVAETIACLNTVEQSLAKYRFDEMASALYHFTWGTFCDWYLEFTKPVLNDGKAHEKQETKDTLAWVLGQILHMLHPIMPFITEELWQNLAPSEGLLMTHLWPLIKEERAQFENPLLQSRFQWLIEVISTIRRVRSEANVPVAARLTVMVVLENKELSSTLAMGEPLIKRLARLDSFAVGTAPHATEGWIQALVPGAQIFLNVSDVIDLKAERTRLTKQLEQIEAELKGLNQKLENADFVANAPGAVIEKNKERLVEAQIMKEKLQGALAQLG
jgi:valyl-tRNA synthetase